MALPPLLEVSLTAKFVFEKSVLVQALPHRSLEPPKARTVSVVVLGVRVLTGVVQPGVALPRFQVSSASKVRVEP